MPAPALPRLLTSRVRAALTSSPVVVVSGARQTGKSTLVRALGDEDGRRYLTLDDFETLERARLEPDALVGGDGPLTLDEVQRTPDLLVAIKRAVDEDRRPGRFLLTGSADLLLMDRVAESLAGRAVHLALWPMTLGEQAGLGRAGVWTELFESAPDAWPELLAGTDAAPADSSPTDWRLAAARGGYPVPALELRRDADARELWFDGYARTYLERDLRELANVASLVDFRRLMRAACLRLGNLVNQTDLGRDVGLSQPTVHRHLALLETSYQLVRVAPYSVNRTKRLVKSPKLFWADAALAMHLAGESEPRGAHLENLVLGDLLAWSGAARGRPEVLYWRTTTGKEVDFVIEWGGRLLPIEVKATARPHVGDAAGLRVFREEYPEATCAGLLLHTGDELGWIAEGVLAAPWWRVLRVPEETA